MRQGMKQKASKEKMPLFQEIGYMYFTPLFKMQKRLNTSSKLKIMTNIQTLLSILVPFRSFIHTALYSSLALHNYKNVINNKVTLMFTSESKLKITKY